jgi:integrase
MSKADRLTDKIVKSLPVPEKGNRLTYDPDVKGFAVRVTVKGARSYVLNYRTKSGQERRFTIGEAGAWSTSAAREEARALKRQIDQGDDPLETLKAHRTAPTVAELAMRFEAEHLPRCRPLTERDYRRILANDIVPALGRLKVADVAYEHIDGLHRTITRRGSPIVANRAVAITSKMFSMAIRWRWRADNPAKGIARNHENKRQRYLTHGELSRLGNALAGHQDLDAANAVRLLLLTGARRMEVLGCTWEQFDLDAGIWTKPGAATKQKTAHRAPLSSGAVTLLQQLKSQSSEDAIYVFPG